MLIQIRVVGNKLSGSVRELVIFFGFLGEMVIWGLTHFESKCTAKGLGAVMIASEDVFLRAKIKRRATLVLIDDKNRPYPTNTIVQNSSY